MRKRNRSKTEKFEREKAVKESMERTAGVKAMNPREGVQGVMRTKSGTGC